MPTPTSTTGRYTPPVLHAADLLEGMAPGALVDALGLQHSVAVDAVGRYYAAQARPSMQENGFLIWPAWRFGKALGAKLVTVFPDNATRVGEPSVHSTYVLFDATEGRILCFIVGEEFTTSKTAADSALGARLLARQDAHSLLAIGAGPQAEAQIRFLLCVCPQLRQVALWNRTTAKADLLAKKFRHRAEFSHHTFTVARDLEEAVRSADVVSCATSSGTPVVQGAWLKPGSHVDLVGGYTPGMREVDDEAVLRARLYVDHRLIASQHCGDICDPLARGVIASSDVQGDLFDLCGGKSTGRQSPADITLFKNGGGGHLDLMFAQTLYERARTLGWAGG